MLGDHIIEDNGLSYGHHNERKKIKKHWGKGLVVSNGLYIVNLGFTLV